jgi:hypothetical protein
MRNYPFKNRNRKIGVLFICVSLFLGCNQRDFKERTRDHLQSEFTHRMMMSKKRLKEDNYKPVFTKEFVLADVNINPDNPRRFYNYSGDLSGRYIECLSAFCNNEKCGYLDKIVEDALLYQHDDGRFGDQELVFTEEYIDQEHTALLWGNGRLLTGLLEYYKYNPKPEILHAAKKIGDFFLTTYDQVTSDVVKRLEGLGAAGIICFTQYVGPLASLSRVTGNPVYAKVASSIYKTLPPRGIQHSHGYLTTLRGILDLYEYDNDETHFEYVLNAYNDLISSDDFTIYGSVKEYFGGKGGRDEGCSTADFIGLSLRLYRITNNIEYLARAEFAIYNALYFNQFFTGDFGHHTINHETSGSDIVNAAWWCCTMSGLRVFTIIKDEYFVEINEKSVKLNFFLDTDYTDEKVNISINRGDMDNDYHTMKIKIGKFDINGPLKIRRPEWVEDMKVLIKGNHIESQIEDNYFIISEQLSVDEQITVQMKYQTIIVKPDKSTVSIDEIEKEEFGALQYGPYIMAVDNYIDYTFLSEPNNNIVYLNTIKNAKQDESLKEITSKSFIKDAYLTANYKHAGFPSYYQTVFRPISEMTFYRHPFMMVSIRFAPEPSFEIVSEDKIMIDPWMEE